ncbi:hypothetical protein NST17_19620 [Caldifermentibacillus hisashii]|uniref:Uncharacterized protein n=1 Tax=Caldifermentibacillus hisashii TaxID=996558 RepID=A0ABU9K2R7_9BACI
MNLTERELEKVFVSYVGKDDLPKQIKFNGWKFDKMKGELLENHLRNNQKWAYTYINGQIGETIRIEFLASYIKTRDELKVKSIESVEVY